MEEYLRLVKCTVACNIIEYPGRKPRVSDSAYIDPMARVMGDVYVGEDVVILFGSIVRGDDDSVYIGGKTAVLENSLIEAPKGYPVRIGESVLISHGAIVHGATVESGSLIGIGAIVLNGARVGREAVVAAGAVVPPGKEVPERTIVAGVPARPVRRVTDRDLEEVRSELEAVHRKSAVYRRILPRLC